VLLGPRSIVALRPSWTASGTCAIGVVCDTTQSMPVLLRQWRDRRGYSVRELARRAGVGHVTVVRIENGHVSPTVAMLEKLARALKINVRDFFPQGRSGRPKRRT
jgi:DNA-binding XRE family transcriptional regulator